jgi:hypothetical protein
VGEIWQTSIRLALVFGPGTVDDVGTLPDNWDPVADPISRTETNWTISGNWTVDGPSIATFNPGDYLNDQVAPAVTAFMLASNVSNQCRVRQLRLWPIGSPLGRSVPAVPYTTGTPCDLEWTSSYPIGAQSSTQLPPQNSVVVSLRTLQIGAAGRGRMFLPSPTSAALSGAKIGTTPQGDIRDAAVAFMEDLAYSAGPFVRPIVTGGDFTKYAVVNRVAVGNVMDTQRRRRNAISEVYVDGTPTY